VGVADAVPGHGVFPQVTVLSHGLLDRPKNREAYSVRRATQEEQLALAEDLSIGLSRCCLSSVPSSLDHEKPFLFSKPAE
jgi:hypothetical protein